MKRIYVHGQPPHCAAGIEGNAQAYATGYTRMEAVGTLVTEYAAELGLKVCEDGSQEPLKSDRQLINSAGGQLPPRPADAALINQVQALLDKFRLPPPGGTVPNRMGMSPQVAQALLDDMPPEDARQAFSDHIRREAAAEG